MAHRITALALKSKASVLAEYNEISNSTETNKGTQMGAAHVSSRARPVFCYNSAISCEKINPVDQLLIEPQVNNPENRSNPVSRCGDCKTVTRSSSRTEDGLFMDTTMRRELCPAHRGPASTLTTCLPSASLPQISLTDVDDILGDTAVESPFTIDMLQYFNDGASTPEDIPPSLHHY